MGGLQHWLVSKINQSERKKGPDGGKGQSGGGPTVSPPLPPAQSMHTHFVEFIQGCPVQECAVHAVVGQGHTSLIGPQQRSSQRSWGIAAYAGLQAQGSQHMNACKCRHTETGRRAAVVGNDTISYDMATSTRETRDNRCGC